MTKLFIYCFFICTVSCIAGKAKSSAKNFSPATAVFSEGIVFISFDFKKENNTVSVAYVETIHSQGTLKTQNKYAQNAQSKYLIQLQDEKGKALMACYIENPFVENKDVFSEDGKIEKHEVTFNEKIISLRIPNLSKQIAKATIFEISSSNLPKYITNLNCQK